MNIIEFNEMKVKFNFLEYSAGIALETRPLLGGDGGLA